MSNIKFDDHIGLVHLQAKKGFKWADGAKSGLTYEDMFQEASVAFVIAADGYDPSTGITFSAYYNKVAFSAFRRSIGQMTGVKNLNPDQRKAIEAHKEEVEKRAAAALPPPRDCVFGIRASNFSDFGTEGEDGFDSFESNIDSGIDSPEEIVAFREIVKESLDRLSPMANLIVSWLVEPPEELKRELELQAAHAEKIQSLGKTHLAAKYTKGLCVDRVGKFLQMIGGASDRELMLAEKELRDAVTRIEKASKYGS